MRAVWLVIIVVAGSCTANAAAASLPGFEYSVHLGLSGSEKMTDNAGERTTTQSASWVLSPKDVDVWLPKFSGPPGSSCAQSGGCASSTATADAKAANTALGPITDSGTNFYASAEHPYSCTASVAIDDTGYQQKTDVGPLSPDVALETDLGFDFVPLPSLEDGGNYPCPGSGEYIVDEQDAGLFDFFGPNPEDTAPRLAVGMLIPAQEIGQATIGGPADDYNNMATTEANCPYTSVGNGCSFSFKLDGDYDLTLVCAGSINASTGTGACGGGGGGSTGGGGGGNPPPPAGGNPGGGDGNHPPTKPPNTKITGKTVNRRNHTARVKFAAIGSATGFRCALVKKRQSHHPGRAAKPTFTKCATPKAYTHLAHGDYTFYVKALNSAGSDPTPATTRFRV